MSTPAAAEKTVTQSMAWLHTWGGIVSGWILFLIFLTGTFTVFFQEISFWMQPERVHAGPISEVEVASIAQRFADARKLHDARLLVRLPNDRRPDISVGVGRRGEKTKTYYLDGSGNDVGARATAGGYLFQALHWRLNVDRTYGEIGVWIVGLATAVMLAVLVSGVIIHKRILKDIFVFRPRSSYQRSWLDGHNVTSVLALPFLFVISFTGLVLVYYVYMPAGISALYGGDRDVFRREAVFTNRVDGDGIPFSRMKPLESFIRAATLEFGQGNIDSIRLFPKKGRTEVEVWRTRLDRMGQQMDRIVFDGESGRVLQKITARPLAQRVQSILSGLHLAEFGGRPMHWLYFAMGLFGAVSIASGLVLFAIKRQRKLSTAPLSERRWLAFAARGNVAAVAGLCVACAAYLWANRLLPAAVPSRDLIEIQLFFAVWALCLAHALLRPHLQAWIEQFYGAALFAVLLPAVNAATTGQWVGTYAAGGDVERLGVELATVAIGVVLAGIAWKVSRAAAARAHELVARPDGVRA